MAPVYSVPASTSLVNEVNRLSPARSRISDGTIGDRAHADSSSDHNLDESGATPSEDADGIDEVHARDITAKGPWPAQWSMERIVQTILRRCRDGREVRLQNIIYNGRIWSRSWEWTQRDYRGDNPHDKHAHFGFRYGSGPGPGNPENITAPWGILAAYEQENEMDAAQTTAWARSEEGKDALADAAGRGWHVQTVGGSGLTAATMQQRTYNATQALVPLATQILALVTEDEDVDTQALIDGLGPILVAGIVDALPELDGATPEQVRAEVEAGVRSVLGGLDSGTSQVVS